MSLTPTINLCKIKDEIYKSLIQGVFMVEKVVLSYLAGAMDGDGSFSIIKHNTKANPNYYPLLQLTNWRKNIVDLFKDTFSGSITVTDAAVKKDGSSGHVIYRWRLRSCSNVKKVLEQLIPFLKTKKERAIYLLDFINKFEFVRGHKLKSEILEKRESARLKMIDFNCWKSAFTNLTSKTARINSKDKEFWAYVAGIMDTDGSFSVKKQQCNSRTDVINPRYLPALLISSVDTRALNYIKRNCHLGKVYNPKNKATSSGYHYQFGIYSRKDCAEFIKNILPFLVGKKENAKCLLDFCENAKNTKYCKEGISKTELQYREGCYQNLIALNNNGVSKSSLMDLNPLTGDAEGNKGQAAQACSLNAVSGETPKGDAVL